MGYYLIRSAVGFTTKSTTNKIPYRMVSGQDPVFSIELGFPPWHILSWKNVHATAKLLATRARQMERRDEDLEEIILYLERMRTEGEELFDHSHCLGENEPKKLEIWCAVA